MEGPSPLTALGLSSRPSLVNPTAGDLWTQEQENKCLW